MTTHKYERCKQKGDKTDNVLEEPVNGTMVPEAFPIFRVNPLTSLLIKIKIFHFLQTLW